MYFICIDSIENNTDFVCIYSVENNTDSVCIDSVDKNTDFVCTDSIDKNTDFVCIDSIENNYDGQITLTIKLFYIHNWWIPTNGHKQLIKSKFIKTIIE